MPTAFKSIGKFKSFSIRLIAIISAGITLVVVVLLVGLVMNLVWGGIPPTDDSRLPSHMQNRPYMWFSEIDPFLRAVLLVVTAGPTFAVYNLVQRKLTKQAVAKIGPLEYPEEVKVFIRNTERAWSSFEGDAPSGMVGRTALQMMLGNMSSGTLIGSKALRILFESSNLYPNEFFIASDEAQSIYVLTNRRILNLYLFGEPPKQVNLDQMVSYDYVKKNFGGRAIMIKTRTGDFETEVNGDQLKFALKMKNWIDQNNRIDELR